MSNKQKLGILLVISTLIRLVVGSKIQLGNDEVYYWDLCKKISWTGVILTILRWLVFFQQLFSLNLLVESELTLRLGFIISGTLSTLLMYLIGKGGQR